MTIPQTKLCGSLLLLQKVVTDTKEDFAGFLTRCKENILGIFATCTIQENIEGITKSKLLDILDQRIDTLSVQVQAEQQSVRLDTGATSKKTLRLDENMRKHLTLDRNRKDTIQLCYSLPQYYVDSIREPEDFVVLPSKVTERMKQRLQINVLDPDCKNFKQALLKFQSLSYTKGDKTVSTDRIGNIDGMPISTQIQRTLYEVTFGKATKGEARKSEYSATVNPYSSVYSLMRGQQYAIQSIDAQIDQTDHLLVEIKRILSPVFDAMSEDIQSVKTSGTNIELKKLINEIRNAKSFFLMSSKIYRFQKVRGQNISIDQNLLLGGSNDISKRRKQLLGIAMKVGEHFDALESKLEHNEKLVSGMIADLYSLFYVCTRKSYSDFNRVLARYLFGSANHEQLLPMEPFSSFLQQFHTAFGHARENKQWRKVEMDTPLTKESQLFCLRVLFLSLAKKFAAYTLEHKIKMEDDFQIPSFAAIKSSCNYDEITKLFPNATDHELIKEINDVFFSHLDEQMIQLEQAGDDKEKICAILQEMQK